MVSLHRKYNLCRVAVTFVIATFTIISCGKKLKQIEILDPDAPKQVIEGMSATKSDRGVLEYKMEAPLMEVYEDKETNTNSEIFPNGFNLYGYNGDGVLETHIYADIAKHISQGTKESWEAYSNVKVENFLQGRIMETDTLFWDRDSSKIYTHSYIKMYSQDGFLQGYGMIADDKGRNATIFSPFESDWVLSNTRKEVEDSTNFSEPQNL